VTAVQAPARQPDERDTQGRRRSLLWDAFCLTLVIGTVLGVALLGRDVPIGSDPVRYVLRSQTWPDIGLGHQQLRSGLMIPLRLLTGAFGPTQFLFHAVATGLTAMWAVSVWALGRVLGGRLVGTAAALALVLHPVAMRSGSYRVAGQIMPDVPAAAMVTLGVALVLVAVSHPPGPRARRWLIAAGVCLGVGYLFREYVPLFYAVVPVVLWLHRRPWRELVPVAVPPLLILVGETVMHGLLFGQPLVRFTVAGSHGRVRTNDPIAAAEALGKLWEAILVGPDDVAALLLLGAIVITLVAAAWRGSRDLVLLAVWILLSWLALTLAAGLVRPGQPLLPGANLRYWAILFAPAVVGTLLVVRDAWRGRWLARAGAAALVAAFVATSAAGVAIRAEQPTSDEEWNELRAWLRSNGDDVEAMDVDSWTFETLELYRRDAVGGQVRWDGELRRRMRGEAPDIEGLRADAPGTYAVITRWQRSPWPHLEEEDARLVFRSETGWIRVYEVQPYADAAGDQVDEDAA
jgi:hypothetical protein